VKDEYGENDGDHYYDEVAVDIHVDWLFRLLLLMMRESTWERSKLSSGHVLLSQLNGRNSLLFAVVVDVNLLQNDQLPSSHMLISLPSSPMQGIGVEEKR
jgi:hypothetical protein